MGSEQQWLLQMGGLSTKAPSELRIALQGIQAAIIRNYLPFAFLIALTVALSWPWLGQQVLAPKVADVHVVTFINICIVFFISGLTLRTDELRAAFTRRTAPGTAFGLISIVGITPLLGYAVRNLALDPAVYATGLAIFCVVPTTLGVGVSLVTSAKGNVALAIFLTVATNLIGVVLIPLWLKAMLSSGAAGVASLNITYVDIFVKLLISFLVPTVIGKMLRELMPAVFRFQREYKVTLSIISNTNLALLIWQTISSAREQIINTSFGTMLLVIVSCFIIHSIYLVFNSIAVALLRVPLLEAVATVIMASQKSAPVAVTVITYLTTDTRVQGLLAVPCVTGQLLQIFLGQPLSHYLADRIKRKQQQEKEAAALQSTSADDCEAISTDIADAKSGDVVPLPLSSKPS